MDFLIPFPFPHITSGCQRAHYAKPSAGVRRAHGRLISKPLRLRVAICRFDFQRRCGRLHFPPSGLVFCGPECRKSVRSLLCLRLVAVFIQRFPPSLTSTVFAIRAQRHMLHPSADLNQKTSSAFGRPGDTFRKKHPPTRGAAACLFSASRLIGRMLPVLEPHNTAASAASDS